MRKSGWVMVALIGLALAGAAALYERPAEAPPPPAVRAPAPRPRPADELRGATAKIEPPAPSPAAPPPAPAAKPASDLPTIEVAQRPVHTVPDEDTPAPRISLFDRSGKEITPRQSASVPRAAPRTPPPSAAPFIANAQAAGGTALTIAGKSVRLFGVRVADARDRCGLGAGDSRSCAEVARDTLAQRLKHNPSVSCRVPAGQQGEPAVVCVDAAGTDLGGFLVAEGLALADTSASYEYFGSEGVARYFGRGLWRYRR